MIRKAIAGLGFVVAILAGAGAGIQSMIVRFNHPEYTETQVMFAIWPGLVLIIIGIALASVSPRGNK